MTVAFVSVYIKGHFSKSLHYRGSILLPLAICANTQLSGYTTGVWFNLRSIVRTSQSKNVWPSALLTTETKFIALHKPQINPL